MMKKNRLLAAFLALVLALGTLAVPIAFADVSENVTTDVTDSAKLADLEISSNYTVSATLSGITPSLAQNLASDNLFKNSGTTFNVVKAIDNKEYVLGRDGDYVANNTLNLPYITDGYIDNGAFAKDANGKWSYCYCHSQFLGDGTVQGYLTFGLDDIYTLDDIYLIGAWKGKFALKQYKVYVSENASNLFDDQNEVLSFNYDKYLTGDGDTAANRLNSNLNYSEGQVYRFNGETKPVGKYIGYKIIDSASSENEPGWLYISEAGAHGKKVIVPHDIPADKREYFTYSDSYNTYLQTSDITVDTISELYADSFLTGNGTMVLGSTAGASDLGNGFTGTYRSITDGGIDNNGAWNSGSFFYTSDKMPQTTPQGYLTLTLKNSYVFDKLYIMSAHRAAAALCNYEVYIGDDKDTLYTDANHVYSFNYGGYYIPWSDDAAAKATKLNHANGDNNSEGQIYTFNGETKPTGKYIGLKINDAASSTTYPGWFYISEIGALGRQLSAVNTDVTNATKQAKLSVSSFYDMSLQTANVTASDVAAIYASDTDLHSSLNSVKLTNAERESFVPNTTQLGFITDGYIYNELEAKLRSTWNYTNNCLVTQADGSAAGYLTADYGSIYEFSKLYLFSHIRNRFAFADYEIYVANSENDLYNSENKVASFKYDYIGTQNNDDKLNEASGYKQCEGQIFNFTGDTKPTGQYVGYKIFVAATASETQYQGWFCLDEIGAAGLPIEAKEITVDANDDTFVSPTKYVVGSNYKFTVDVKNAGSVTKVTANGAELTADQRGYYNVGNAPENITVAVETTRDSYAPKNNVWNGKDITMRSSGYYNPTWNQEKFGNESVMRDETVMFYSGRTSAKLLYPIDNIVSVYTYDLTDGKRQKFYLGEDFTVNADGEMVLTDSTNIPVYANGDKLNNITTNESGGYTIDWSFIGAMKTVQPQYLISVTYTHTREWSGTEYGTAPDSQLGNLKFSKKAANGETTNVLFLGDSITTGCNATGQDIVTFNYNGGADVTVGSSPSMVIKGWEQYLGCYGSTSRPEWTQSAWADLVVDGLKAQYGNDNITITNRGIGSSDSAWYYKNIEAIVNKDVVAKPDLVFIAFGMNEAGNTKATQNANTQKIIDYIREWNPDCSVVLVSAFSPNMYTTSANPQPTTKRLGEQEEGYKELAATDDNMAYAPVFSEFQKIRASKEGVDYTGNNYNHVNDFGVNLYANTILAVLDKEEVTHTVTFLNKNGTVLGTEAVADGSAVSVNKAAEYAANADEIFGYTKGINGNFWDSDITLPITADMTFTAVYTKNDVSAVLTVEDNGTKIENHSFDERVSVTAEKTEGFLGWRDKSSGAVLSTSRKYTFYLPGEIDLEAVYESDGVNSLTVDSSVLNTSVHYAATAVGYKATVTGISAVPTGATVTEKGFVITNRTGYAAAHGEVTLNMATKQIETANKPANGNYMLTIAINAGQKRYVRAYVTYTLNGVSHTEYSKHTAFINYTAS